jgi:hypothetical protein
VSTATFHSLRCHPAGNPPAELRMDVAVSRQGNGDLHLHYRLHGISRLVLPAPATPGVADGLWQHTCCEAFVATVDGPAYREFNFSPSGQWAVYDFADYRQRRDDWPAMPASVTRSLTRPLTSTMAAPAIAPAITCHRDGEKLHLAATLPAVLLPAGAARLGLTVVAESPLGEAPPAGPPDHAIVSRPVDAKTYWALAHAGERPDFHLAASFTLPLP